jgi:hypothetical protein
MFRFHDPRGGPLTIAFGRWPMRSEGRSTIKETDRMYLWREGCCAAFALIEGTDVLLDFFESFYSIMDLEFQDAVRSVW